MGVYAYSAFASGFKQNFEQNLGLVTTMKLPIMTTFVSQGSFSFNPEQPNMNDNSEKDDSGFPEALPRQIEI